MGFADITAEAVHSTLDEFDKLGRDAFLARYGFGPARSYFLIHDGKSYDSKATSEQLGQARWIRMLLGANLVQAALNSRDH